MRGSEYLVLVVVLGIIAITFGAYVYDLNKNYNGYAIDEATIAQYDDFQKVANTANKTFENFRNLGGDSNWFQKIGAGIVAIPYAVISFPIMIYEAVSALTKFMGGGLTGIVPAGIIVALIALFTIEVVRRLLEFFQRARA